MRGIFNVRTPHNSGRSKTHERLKRTLFNWKKNRTIRENVQGSSLQEEALSALLTHGPVLPITQELIAHLLAVVPSLPSRSLPPQCTVVCNYGSRKTEQLAFALRSPLFGAPPSTRT